MRLLFDAGIMNKEFWFSKVYIFLSKKSANPYSTSFRKLNERNQLYSGEPFIFSCSILV